MKSDLLEGIKRLLLKEGIPLKSIRIDREGYHRPSPSPEGPLLYTLIIEGEILAT